MGCQTPSRIHIITSKLLRSSSGCGERGGIVDRRCFDVCLEGEYGLALLVEDVPGVHVSVLPGHEEDGGSGGAPAAVQQPLRVGAADTQLSVDTRSPPIV